MASQKLTGGASQTNFLEHEHKNNTAKQQETPHPSKQMVEKGYDQMAQTYLSWTSLYPSPREAYTHKLLALLQPPSTTTLSTLSRAPKILELGCGAGIPCTKLLVESGADVVANDISEAQIELARKHVAVGTEKDGENEGVGKAEFVKGDMMGLSFEEAAFDAVVAFYSIIHLPRSEQEILMKRIYGWLKEGGYFLLNLGTSEVEESVGEDWLGAKMFWSGYGREGNIEMTLRSGFAILEESVVVQQEEEDKFVPFLWVLAKKQGEREGKGDADVDK